MISFSIGSAVIYRIVLPRSETAAYGVGFVFTVLNWLLDLIMVPAVYSMISNDGQLLKTPSFNSPKDARKSFIGN